MRVQLLSDLHIEFREYQYQDIGCDVVVLAGDIHTKDRGFKWALENIKNRPVIYVLGNHEFYGETYPKLISKLKRDAKGTNIHILENDVVRVGDVNFFGSTMWTDFELFGDSKNAMSYSWRIMSDYKKIRKMPNYSKICPLDIAIINKKTTTWLSKELKARSSEKNVVVTHHAPTPLSAPKHLREELIMEAYISDMREFILEHNPDYWLHGHLHYSANYKIGNTQIISNPRGYPDEFDSRHNPILYFEI